MKRLLSFFIAACTLPFFSNSHAAAAEQKARIKMRISASVFEAPRSSFTCKLTPVRAASFYTGNLSFGGLWSSFLSASPNALQPLKQPVRLTEPLSVRFGETGLFPLYTAVECTYADIKSVLFIGLEKHGESSVSADYPIRIGAAVSFPFTLRIPSKGHRQYLHAAWTIAWRRSFIHSKQIRTWFTAEPFFESFYANTVIQQLSVQSSRSSLLVQAGCAENPYGAPAYFGKTELSQIYGRFSHNVLAFFCTHNYLNQNASFEKERIKLFYNPQFRSDFKNTALKSLVAGISAGLWYEEKETARAAKKLWHSSVKTRIKLHFIRTEFTFGASLVPLYVTQRSEQIVLNPECGIRITGRRKKRTMFVWNSEIQGTLYPAHTKMLHTVKTENGVAVGFPLVQKAVCTASAKAILSCTVPEKSVPTSVSTSIKFRLSVKPVVCPGKLRAGLNAYTEFLLKNSALKTVRGDVVFMLYL